MKGFVMYYTNNNIVVRCLYGFPYGHFSYMSRAFSAFSHGVKMASTPSTLSTMLKMSVLYILHLFYKPSTNFYKMMKLLKPSTNYFIFYRISTNVEALENYKLLIINSFCNL